MLPLSLLPQTAFKALPGTSPWPAATLWLQHKCFRSDPSLGDIFQTSGSSSCPASMWQEKVSLETLCNCWGLTLFCSAKSRSDLPKVSFAQRIFKRRQWEICTLTIKQFPAEHYCMLGFHSVIISPVCILILNSKLSHLIPSSGPQCCFPNQGFLHPSCLSWIFSLSLWYLHELGTFEFYMPDLFFFFFIFFFFFKFVLLIFTFWVSFAIWRTSSWDWRSLADFSVGLGGLQERRGLKHCSRLDECSDPCATTTGGHSFVWQEPVSISVCIWWGKGENTRFF